MKKKTLITKNFTEDIFLREVRFDWSVFWKINLKNFQILKKKTTLFVPNENLIIF